MTSSTPSPEQIATPAAPAPGPEAPGGMSRQEVGQALSGLLLGMFVSLLASTIVSNALPRIIADLHGSQSVYTWVITAELLSMTAAVPLWGKMADLFSKKVLVQLSLGLFVCGSLIAGFAPNVEILIASRVLQGIGAGGINALAIIVLASMVPPREMGRYSGLFGAILGVATVTGPLIGGLLVDTSWLGWRWCFFIAVPLSLAAIALLQRTLHLPVMRRKVQIDWLGAALIILGVCTLLIWSTLAGDRYPWLSWQTAVLVTGGLLTLVLAVYVESRVPEPIIPLTLFRIRTMSLATLATAAVGVIMFGSGVFVSQYLQISQGRSPTMAGLMILPMVFGLLLASTYAGQQITRHGRWKPYLVVGAVLMTVGMALFATIDARTSIWPLFGYELVLGVGVGLLVQNLVLAVQNDVPVRNLGAATSTVSFFRSLGGAVGVNALGAVLAYRVTHQLGTAAGGHGSTRVPKLSELPAPVLAAVQDAYGTATAHMFLIGTPVAAIALLAIVFIKEKPLHTQSGDQRRATETAAATPQ
ncbi:MDR family MFS transporter [Dactylosporangium sp. NPDC051484]|uniref:MDR family MFS transporter n=1 Tax=Dactylosporangium sp. NPDC051484 TaxID=3154942 RepID=UPI00344F8A58